MKPELMRNVLDSLTIIVESRGLAGRKPGDAFVDSSGDILVFNGLQFFPSEGGTLSPEQLDATVKNAEEELGPIQWENTRSGRTGGFAIASFDHGGQPLYVGTFLQNVKANPMDNKLENLVLKRYRFSSKAAAKTQAGLTPQDILTERNDLTADDILRQVGDKFGADSPLYHITQHIAMGEPLPFEINTPEGISFTAFRDYFCELLQPIALQRGLYTGNAGKAADIFLSPEGFESTTISFDDSKNAGLADSIMSTSDGRFIKVSSKGDKGAEASVKNLVNSIDELSESERGQKLLKRYDQTIEMIRDVVKAGQSGSPLYLGVKFGIIDSSEAQIIRGLKNVAKQDLSDEKTVTKRMKELGLTDKLISLANNRVAKNRSDLSLYYHLLASVAHKAADYVNDKTNFGEAASTILNNGALVQVYTKATEKGSKWVLNGFETVYPGDSVSGVVISAQKNYSSTEIKGNFTFKILRGKTKAEDEKNEDESSPDNVDFGGDSTEYDPNKKSINPLKDRPSDREGAGRERRTKP